jgi:hypothetical protein
MTLVEKFAVCPNCKGTDCYRSRRRGAMEFFFHYFLFTSPYRCKDCDTRFLHRRIAKDSGEVAAKQSPPSHAAHSA